jgi:hypothetical protein
MSEPVLSVILLSPDYIVGHLGTRLRTMIQGEEELLLASTHLVRLG